VLEILFCTMNQGNLLIVDDNSNAIKALRLFLKHEFDQVKGITNPNSIPHEFNTNYWDVVLLDMNFSSGLNTGNEGFYWLKEIKKISPGWFPYLPSPSTHYSGQIAGGSPGQ